PLGKPKNLSGLLILISFHDMYVLSMIYYGHIKWIEDLVPRAMWIQQPIDYNRHALWGGSHWGQKRQQFYGYAVNWKSTLDVYSKRRIICKTHMKNTINLKFSFTSMNSRQETMHDHVTTCHDTKQETS
nr:hypothetical protein [Tanacetum cinerariifolium]